MTSHFAGTVQMTEVSESGTKKWEEMWFKTTAEDGEREGSSDVRWKTVPQTSGCNRKCSVTDSGQTSISVVNVNLQFQNLSAAKASRQHSLVQKTTTSITLSESK